MIHTALSLRSARRRAEARLDRGECVLRAMRGGAALHLEYTPAGSRWTLTNGQHVADDVARFVIGSSSVIDVGDALFADVAGQTWRWWRE